MILAGDLRRRRQAQRSAIAALLGVSRGPVREAFRALEESGLVRLEKNRGVFVRQIGSRKRTRSSSCAPCSTSSSAAASRRLDADAVQRAARAGRAHGAGAAAKDDVDGYHLANLAFHDRLVELAGNAKLLRHSTAASSTSCHLYRRATLAQAGALPLSIARAPRRSSKTIAAGQAAAAGRALYDT